LIDIRNIRLSVDDAGEAIKDSKFSRTVNDADALIFVVPEYNHSFPGLLKHVLDTNLKEYIHKAAGVCGVSAGPFGGARMIQNFLPVLRELGMVTIFSDVYLATLEDFSIRLPAKSLIQLTPAESTNSLTSWFGWRECSALAAKHLSPIKRTIRISIA
jgi:NAD(P)H-dependent FMN reductase